MKRREGEPASGWCVEYVDRSGRLERWVRWWRYDSQHSAECAAGHVWSRGISDKVRIRYEEEADARPAQGDLPFGEA